MLYVLFKDVIASHITRLLREDAVANRRCWPTVVLSQPLIYHLIK